MLDSDTKPSRIGGFELLATLGKGAMGVVFKARQVSMDRIVALKVLPPHLAKDEAYVARFLREARSAAKLNHPNIVQGIDVGVADGNYYFAMEFVDGTTVKELLKAKGRLDEKGALNIVGAVARALEHAHEHGIIHRDIKPDNIMVTKKGEVKLADLGLARSTEKPDTMTIEGTTLGTPYYMAPEQVRAQADIDTRADIYALGATLYHMVTGEQAYSGPNAGAIMARHLADPVPSARDKHPDVSRATDDLIQRMMAKDREDRPQTPKELFQEVKDALAGKVHLRAKPEGRRQPAGGHPRGVVGGVSPRREAPSSSKTTWIVLAAVAAIALIAAVIVLGRGSKPAEQAKDIKPDTSSPTKSSTPPPIHSSKHPPKEEGEAQRDVAALRAEAAALATKDQFADAMKQADVLALKHPAAVAEIDKVRQGIVALAERRYDELSRAADAAIEAKDFAKARDALKPVASFGIAELAERAKKRLAEIASREKGAAEWAKWDALKADVRKLIAAGKLDDAAKLLDGAKALPLEGISDLIAEQMKTIEAAKRKAAEAALAAYQAESDNLWALFKERKYPEADALLKELAADPRFGVRPSGAEDIRVGDADSVAAHLKADQEAAKLLKEFWAAVERGVMARKGKFVSIAGKGGNVEKAEAGQVTLKVGAKELTAPLLGMEAAQAAAIAALKEDDRGNLTRAIFLLAEGEKLDDAEKLLAAAGKAPALPVYRKRLDRLLGGARAVADAKDAEAREAAARDAWRRIEAPARGNLTQEQAQRLLPLIGQFAQKHAGTRFYEGVSAEAKAIEARVRRLAYAGVKRLDLLAEYRAGRWKDVVFRGRWVREADGYRIDPVGGGGPDFGWAYPLPEGTLSFRLLMRFRMAPAGAIQVTLGETPGIGTGMGVTLCYHVGWGAGLSAGRLNRERNNLRTVPLFEISSGWHSLIMDVDPKSITATLDDKSKVEWEGQTDPKCITISGDEFGGWRIQSLAAEVSVTAAPPGPEHADDLKTGPWQSLFDGKTLKGWRTVSLGEGAREDLDVSAQNGTILLQARPGHHGVVWEQEFPKEEYEVSFAAMRLNEGPGFCLMVFPVGGSFARLVLDEWAPGVVGIDFADAPAYDNPSARRVRFERNRWYTIRLRVTQSEVRAWLDTEELFRLGRVGLRFGMGWESQRFQPFGLASTAAKVALRNIRLRRIEPGAAEAPKPLRQPVPFVGKPLFIEAEVAHVCVEPMEVGQDNAASGGMFVWQPGEVGQNGGAPDARVVFLIAARRDCTAYLWGRVVAPHKNDDSFLVGVAPGVTKSIERLSTWNLARHAQWEWVSFDARAHPDATTHTPTPMDLKAGVNSLVVAVREDGTKLDKICITPTPEPPPEDAKAGE